MRDVHVLNTIPVVFPEREILFRLKFNIHKTELDERQREKFKSIMMKAFALCNPTGAWLELPLLLNDGSRVVFEGGYEIKSHSIAELLRNCDSAFFMGVTVGGAVSALANEYINAGDGALALIADAVGSETAEAAIDWLNSYLAGYARRKGKVLTSQRFSAGYGDFLLENQRLFYEILDLQNFGVSLTDTFIFVPEKTVTAIVGAANTSSMEGK